MHSRLSQRRPDEKWDQMQSMYVRFSIEFSSQSFTHIHLPKTWYYFSWDIYALKIYSFASIPKWKYVCTARGAAGASAASEWDSWRSSETNFRYFAKAPFWRWH